MRALAQYVMRGPMQAGGVAAVATALPLLFWIGAAVIGLVILRLGIRQGLNIGLWAVLPALGWATFGQDPTALVVLLQVVAQAYINYGVGFLEDEAEALQEDDPDRASALRRRAREYYRRARAYGFRLISLDFLRVAQISK